MIAATGLPVVATGGVVDPGQVADLLAVGDTDRAHLWAGTGYRHAPTGPAGDVVATLAAAL